MILGSATGLVAALLVLVGCGRMGYQLGFEDVSSGGVDGVHDGAVLDASTTDASTADGPGRRLGGRRPYGP